MNPAEWIKHFVAEPPATRGLPLPSIAVCIVTATPALCERAIELAMANRARGVEVYFYVYANACKFAPTYSNTFVIESPTNDGVVPPMHTLYQRAASNGADIVMWMHDDVEIYEPGWDARVAARFKASPDCMMVGFGGAASLGRRDMYTCGSMAEPTRGPFGSNLTQQPGRSKDMTVAEVHGPRITCDCKAATIDGFVIACRRTFLDDIGGLSWWKIIHHGFDSALACQVRRAGKETWIVPVAMGHPWIGNTSQREDGLALMAKGGGNYGLFLRAHEMLREQFKDVLPFALPGIEHVSVDPQNVQPIFDNYFGSVKVSALPPDHAVDTYCDLLKLVLVRDPLTLAKRARLDAVHQQLDGVLARDVPGDIVASVATAMVAAGVLKARNITGRTVWHGSSAEKFERYNLDGANVRPLESRGDRDMARLALLYLDYDTIKQLPLLYPRLSRGAVAIFDGYFEDDDVRAVVDAYRREHKIDERITRVGDAAMWQREKMWWRSLEPAKVTLVIPTLTEAGAKRTALLYANVMQGTRRPENVFIIDNGGYVAKLGVHFNDDVEVCKPSVSLSVAASWNFALGKFNDWCIFANDDVEIEPDTIERFVDAAEMNDARVLITCDQGSGFPFFLLKKRAAQIVGVFDEQFSPAYYEDTDYLRRLALVQQEPVVVRGGVTHDKPGTTSRELGTDLEELLSKNLARYIAKWGGPPGKERSTPAQLVIDLAPVGWKRKPWE